MSKFVLYISSRRIFINGVILYMESSRSNCCYNTFTFCTNAIACFTEFFNNQFSGHGINFIKIICVIEVFFNAEPLKRSFFQFLKKTFEVPTIDSCNRRRSRRNRSFITILFTNHGKDIDDKIEKIYIDILTSVINTNTRSNIFIIKKHSHKICTFIKKLCNTKHNLDTNIFGFDVVIFFLCHFLNGIIIVIKPIFIRNSNDFIFLFIIIIHQLREWIFIDITFQEIEIIHLRIVFDHNRTAIFIIDDMAACI